MERGSLLPLSLRKLASAALSPEDFRPRVQASPRPGAAPPARGMVWDVWDVWDVWMGQWDNGTMGKAVHDLQVTQGVRVSCPRRNPISRKATQTRRKGIWSAAACCRFPCGRRASAAPCHRPTQGVALGWYVTPLQGLGNWGVASYPGRCPGLVYHAPLGLVLMSRLPRPEAKAESGVQCAVWVPCYASAEISLERSAILARWRETFWNSASSWI